MKKVWTLAAVVAASGVGCLGGGSKETVVQSFQAKLDSSLTAQERLALLEDGEKLAEMLLQAPGESGGSNSFARLVFGSDSIDGVLKYLDERVNYVISYTENVEDHLAEIVANDENSTPVSEGMSPADSGVTIGKYRRSEEMAQEFQAIYRSAQKYGLSRIDDEQTIAANLGTLGWFISLAMQPKETVFRFGETILPIQESRVGVVQLGRIYSKRRFLGLGEAKLPSIVRISTLVHEARHSDCTGGVTMGQVEALLNQGVVLNPSCGHLHGECPAGHDLAGITACDTHAWGAYAVGAVFSAWVERSCTSCTEKERQASYADALDSISRVVPIEAMLNGEAGLPDMSSSGVISEN